MRSEPIGGLKLGSDAALFETMLSERDRQLREIQAVVQEREATIREREDTVRQREETVRQCEAKIGLLTGIARAVSEAPLAQVKQEANLESAIETLWRRLEGWCSLSKAIWLARLVLNTNARRICEIGVYGGRSLLPMALAAQLSPDAVVWAVEPWSNRIAITHSTSEENDNWWHGVDLHAVKYGFLTAVLAYGLGGIVKVIELPSDAARLGFLFDPFFGFDLLHIDGSHSEAQALADVMNWLPLVVPGGVVVLDDIGWETVRKAREYLGKTCDVVEEVEDAGDGVSYGAYRRRGVEKC